MSQVDMLLDTIRKFKEMGNVTTEQSIDVALWNIASSLAVIADAMTTYEEEDEE